MNIDRISHYLLSEFFRVFVRVLFFFVMLLCCIEWFRQLRFAAPSYQGLAILHYVLLMVPRNLAKAGPLMAVTMSLAVGWRLSQTSELIAIRALGFSLRALLGVIVSIALFGASLLFVSSEIIAPKTTAHARAFRAEHLGNQYAMLKGHDLWVKLEGSFVHVLTQGLRQPIRIYNVDSQWRVTEVIRADDIQSLGPGKWRLDNVHSTYFDASGIRHETFESKIWSAPINADVLHLLKLDLRFSHLKQLWHYLKKVPDLWRIGDYQMACYFLGYRLLQPFLFVGLVVFTFLMLLLPVGSRNRFWLFVAPLSLGTFFYLCFELSLPMMKVFHWEPWMVLSMPLFALLLVILVVGYKVRGRRFPLQDT